jgi:hypothetical protein
MHGAWGFWAGRDLYRATPAVKLGLGFMGLIRRIAPISRLLRNIKGYRGPILTQILMGPPTVWHLPQKFCHHLKEWAPLNLGPFN